MNKSSPESPAKEQPGEQKWIPSEQWKPSTIEFHSAGYFHPDAIVCSAKQAEALFAALTQAQARCAEMEKQLADCEETLRLQA